MAVDPWGKAPSSAGRRLEHDLERFPLKHDWGMSECHDLQRWMLTIVIMTVTIMIMIMMIITIIVIKHNDDNDNLLLILMVDLSINCPVPQLLVALYRIY